MTSAPNQELIDALEARLATLMESFRTLSRSVDARVQPEFQAFFRELFALQTWFQEQRRAPVAAPAGVGEREKRFELLYKSSLALQASLEAPKLLNLALDTLLEMGHCRRGFIATANADGEFGFVAARSFLREDIPEPERQISRAVIERVWRLEQELHIGESGPQDSLLEQSSLVRRDSQALLCVPLIHGKRAIGVIYLDQFQGELDVQTFALVRHFSRQLAGFLHTAETFTALREQHERLRESLSSRFRFDKIVCSSRPMMAVLKTVAKVADTDAPVLIQGETGTGKDLIARALHENSGRRNGPYIEVDCGALPTNLIESELFGHLRGAFTGALADRVGLIEAAAGGTLFLDEINNLPKESQIKLLRVLQSRNLRRIGDTRERPVDFRLVAASSRGLRGLAEADQFRSDLFYRISTVVVDLPPLRERREDIALLAQHFLSIFGARYDRPELRLDAAALLACEGYAWPGNVRELEHVIERGVILCDGPLLRLADLPLELGGGVVADERGELSLEDCVNQAKRHHIARVLRECDGNKAEAAKRLQINRSYLFQLIKQLEL